MKPLLLVSFSRLAAAPAFAGHVDDALPHSKAFERTANARDAKTVLAVDAPDAHVVWPGQGKEATGTAAIEKLVANFLAQLPKDATITLKSQTAIPLASGYVATVGHWEESFAGPDGKPQTAPPAAPSRCFGPRQITAWTDSVSGVPRSR